MLDVIKELEKYKPVDLEEEILFKKETSKIISIFNKNIERIGKEQYKSNRNIDEILEILDEDKSKDELIAGFRDKLQRACEDREMLLKGLIDIVELFEDLYICSSKSLNESFLEQMRLQRENLEQIMQKCGITPIGKPLEMFDKELHIAREVKEDKEKPNMQIMEVIRRGYMYKGEIIRKSEVVVNSYNEGSVTNEQNYWH